jgi:hypothetical protein
MPGSPGGDKRDLFAQTAVNSIGHPRYIMSGAQGLRQTIKLVTHNSRCCGSTLVAIQKQISDSARSTVLLLIHLRRFLWGGR